jgi:hypothetical protein
LCYHITGRERSNEGKKETKKLVKICGDGNCGSVSLLKAVKEWPREAKKGLNFRNQEDIRNQVAAHAKNLSPVLRDQLFYGKYAGDASAKEKAAFVKVWAQRVIQDRVHVGQLFCRLFADMVQANLTIYQLRAGELADNVFMMLDEDSEHLRQAKEGREIELFYSSCVHGDLRRTGHYDLVKTTWS